MKIRQNLHIHTRHSCDSACAEIGDIYQEMLRLGLTEFGISDHLHSDFNSADIENSRRDFLNIRHNNEFHFGIEVSAMSEWECQKIASGDYETNDTDPVYGIRTVEGPARDPVTVAIDREKLEKWGVEYVIGGVHWDGLAGWFKKVNNGQHDYQALLQIPEKYNDALVNAFIKHGKCAELNLTALTHTRYPEEVLKYMWRLFASWREAGVKFTIGSDQHSAHANEVMFSAGALLLDNYGFTEENFKFFF